MAPVTVLSAEDGDLLRGRQLRHFTEHASMEPSSAEDGDLLRGRQLRHFTEHASMEPSSAEDGDYIRPRYPLAYPRGFNGAVLS